MRKNSDFAAPCGATRERAAVITEASVVHPHMYQANRLALILAAGMVMLHNI